VEVTPVSQTIVDSSSTASQELQRFLEYLKLSGAAEETIRGYEVAIKTLPNNGKAYSELTKEDIVAWLHEVDRKYRSLHTKHDYKRRVKRFLRWVHNGDDREKPAPEVVRIIRAGKPRRELGAEVLNEEEIRRMVEVCESQRDRAMVFVLYESGARAGELLSLRLRDVEFDKYGAVIRVRGKTGERRIRLVQSVPDLQLWINMHPSRNDPNAPLWPRERDPTNSLGVVRLEHMVRRYARKAGIQKRVHPHVFRHSRATHLAKVLTEAQLREFFGWTKQSEIPSIYVHLSGRDVDRALLKHYGIEVEEEERAETILKPKNCVRCGFNNPMTARYCARCSAVLDVRTAFEIEEVRREADDLVARVVQEFTRRAPEIVTEILKEMKIGEEFQRLQRVAEKLGDGGISNSS
jgi:integrase/ribosomal protein L40E